MDQELADANTYMRRADAACVLMRWQHFSVRNGVMVAILKLWHHIRNMTQTIDTYLLEEQSCHISSRSDLKRRCFKLFWSGRPQQQEQQQQQEEEQEQEQDE